jgi:hypothetical protein
MVSDYELTNQLYAFMQAVPVLWGWERLRTMNDDKESYVEYRGPKDNFMSFKVGIFEEGVKENGRYLLVMVSVTDPDRAPGTKGSSKTPLTTSFLMYENGELDMPLAREIFERPY